MKLTELHTAFAVIFSLQYSVTSAKYYIEDPCPSEVREWQFQEVTMCNSSYAILEGEIGQTRSIILRLNKYEENCTCHINTTDSHPVNFKPFKSDAVPNVEECGLVVDVSMASDDGTTEDQMSINCRRENYQQNYINVKAPDYFKLTSRIVDGNFTKGYCLQLFREYIIMEPPSMFDVLSQRKYEYNLHIECFGTDVTTPSSQTTETQTSTSLPDTTVRETLPSVIDQSTHEIGFSDSPLRTTTSDATIQNEEVGDNTDNITWPYILTGVFAGTSVIFLTMFIVVFVLYRRHIRLLTLHRAPEKSKQETKVHDSYLSVVDVADSGTHYSSLSRKTKEEKKKYENSHI